MNRVAARGRDCAVAARADHDIHIATDEGHRAGRRLRVGDVDFGVGRVFETAVFDTAANGDDREPIVTEPDPFAERALVRPETFGENFVDDGDAGRALVVALGEIAALLQWNLERREITGT